MGFIQMLLVNKELNVTVKGIHSKFHRLEDLINGCHGVNASNVTISSVEANFMLKNGYLSESDIKGKRNYITASGDIHEGTILRLRDIKLGGAILKNIEASVVHSQKAPLLLGQSVLEKFGTITIDNVNSKLLIKQ